MVLPHGAHLADSKRRPYAAPRGEAQQSNPSKRSDN
jgi:hypothetical protein